MQQGMCPAWGLTLMSWDPLSIYHVVLFHFLLLLISFLIYCCLFVISDGSCITYREYFHPKPEVFLVLFSPSLREVFSPRSFTQWIVLQLISMMIFLLLTPVRGPLTHKNILGSLTKIDTEDVRKLYYFH